MDQTAILNGAHRGADRVGAARVRVLATASALALGLAAHPALAQDATTTEPPADAPALEEPAAEGDEIVVTGFRAALESAQGRKRAADTVVDVITAEDIGALPDRSVAEALQRVPGVNVSRFEQARDPDRFSVEGSGIIIRGLPFTRSELNGREIFSANGGRELSFNDVSPELLGRVEVFKNTTADMIDGGISGTVNLVTRKPLDNPGWNLAGTIEANVGDLAREWSPGFSVLGSNTFETGIGTFGIQLGYAQQELVTRTDASQVTDPCYRADTLDGRCFRFQNVGSGGYFGDPNFTPENFPPADAVVVPKGAGVRTTDLTRDRQAISAVAQWESTDGRALVTLEYLRAKTDATINEYAVLALVNDDNLFPIQTPEADWVFENGIFQSGTLTQAQPFNGGRGIPTELLRFQRRDQAKTEDFSLDLSLAPTDRLRFNAEVQHIRSDRSEDGIIAAMQTYSDVFIDNSGNTPQVQFFAPGQNSSDPAYFTNPARTFFWFLLDNKVRNEGSLTSIRVDGEYDFSDTGFFRKARFGARWADRNRVTRNANFSNWGNLGAPWTGRGGNWNCQDFQAFGCGGAYVFDFPQAANVFNPFGTRFQRGNAPVPLGDGQGFFFGGDDLLAEYLSGLTAEQARAINDFTLTPNRWTALYDRAGILPNGFRPGEVSDLSERTDAFYARADYGIEFSNGWKLDGNIGVRYVRSEVESLGVIGFPSPGFFDTNLDGVVTAVEIQASCANIEPGQPRPSYCELSPARQTEFGAAFTGGIVPDGSLVTFDNWLPSFNAKIDFGGGFLLRGAVSKGISRPDLNAFSAGGEIFDNTRDLQLAGALETGPLFQIFTGNRRLRPIQSWNYDLSFEWYFARVGQLTAALFKKDFKQLIGGTPQVQQFTDQNGVTVDVEVNGPTNAGDATLKGIEVAYQHVYDFLPGVLSGIGSQLTYTYVDSKDFGSSGAIFGDLPQPGVSKHTVNAVLFYEKGPVSARAAYNWRSDFLITPNDVIFPFSPVYGESTGQLDASLFVTVMPGVKLGVQGVNLLDEVTRTSQVIDFDGTRITRSAFRNDRRYTFLARFDF